MDTDKFGRTRERAKASQRSILERARDAYPDYVEAGGVAQNTPERSDIHELIDGGLLERHRTDDPRGVVGDPTLVMSYRLTARGRDLLQRPHWLNEHFPSVVNVTAVGSSVNVNSPHATASTHANINVLVKLRDEVERAALPPEEKKTLLHALDVVLKSASIAAICARLFGGG